MDKDIKKSVENLERGYELAQEEAMHGGRMAQTLEVNEELEDKLDMVKKLKTQIKVMRGISLGALMVLIIVLLYACASMFQKEEPVAEEPEPAVVQSVIDESLFYRMEVPDVDVSQIRSATLDELVSGLSGYDFLDYLGVRYFAGSKAPEGVLVYSMSSLEELVSGKDREYIESEPLPEKTPKTFVEVGCSAHNFLADEDGTYQELPSDFYYNLETIKFGELESSDLNEYLKDNKETFRLTVYGDADVKPVIEKALEGRTYGDTLEGIAEDIVKALAGVEFSIEADGFSYSTYDKAEEQDGNIVCLRGNESVTPEKVVNYDVTVVDYEWNLWVCTAQEVWYK